MRLMPLLGLFSHATAQSLRAVPLFGKPKHETGQLIVMQEGLDVLRRQKEPFAIISAVGPTRTGKSSILGRAFLRGADENAFEIGGGVTSHTGGVWILNEPIFLETPRGKLRVLLVDTEGFHGIGGRTSRTYEANLFGLVWLMSSVLIFNSMFPVDASTIKSLNSFGREAVNVLKELNMHHTTVSKRPASLLWVVQNFNLYNLQNSHMTVEQLHDTLSNGTGVSADSMAASRLLGSSAKLKRGLLDALFSSSRMVPVERPHASDQVLANLATVPSSTLRKAYLDGATRLRDYSAELALPVHTCVRAGKRRRSGECEIEPLDGPTFVSTLERWVELGHITAEEDANKNVNGTALMEAYSSQLAKWLRWRCTQLEQLLTKELKKQRSLSAATAEKLGSRLSSFGKSAISHMVDRREFWLMPGKVAMLTEQLLPVETLACLTSLEDAALKQGVNISSRIALNTSVAASALSALPAADADAAAGGNGQQATDLQEAVDDAVDKATDQVKAKALKEAERKMAARAAKGEASQKRALRELRKAGLLEDDGKTINRKLLKKKLTALREVKNWPEHKRLKTLAAELDTPSVKSKTAGLVKKAVRTALAKEPCSEDKSKDKD